MHLGPLHTLHRPDGTVEQEVFWHEPEYTEDLRLFSPSKGWAKLETYRRWTLRRLRTLPYGRALRDLIIRYAAALDQTTMDVAFLHLWSLLEKITGTVGKNYDETIERAVWGYENEKLHGQMLGAMRLHRNRVVHAAHSGGDDDQVAYMVKNFIDGHLVRLIRNDFDIDSLDEYAEHLKLSTSLTTLKRQHKRVSKALRWIEKTEKLRRAEQARGSEASARNG